MFKDAIRAAVAYKDDSTDFMDEIMRELEVSILGERNSHQFFNLYMVNALKFQTLFSL